MLALIHKEASGSALEESPMGEVCAIPVNRSPFPCFSCRGEDRDESEVRWPEELGV